MTDPLLARVTTDPAVCHGKPCIRDTRYPVAVLLDLLDSGMTWGEILDDFVNLTPDDLRAALAHADAAARRP